MTYGKKRGLSDVVTTVLIILLVLAAVAIIWGYLRGSLVSSGQQVTGQTACLNLDLKTIACNLSAGAAPYSATVKYGRNSADANLTGATLVFVDATGASTTNVSEPIPNVLETKVFTVTGLASKPVSVAIAGTVSTSSGDQNVCDKSDAVTCA